MVIVGSVESKKTLVKALINTIKSVIIKTGNRKKLLYEKFLN